MILTMYEAIVVPPKTLQAQSTGVGVRLCRASTVLSASQGKSIPNPRRDRAVGENLPLPFGFSGAYSPCSDLLTISRQFRDNFAWSDQLRFTVRSYQKHSCAQRDLPTPSGDG